MIDTNVEGDQPGVAQCRGRLRVGAGRIMGLDRIGELPDLFAADDEGPVLPDHPRMSVLIAISGQLRNGHGATEDLLTVMGGRERDRHGLVVLVDRLDPARELDVGAYPSLGTGTIAVKRTLYSVTAPRSPTHSVT